jgi:hypothetical protein
LPIRLGGLEDLQVSVDLSPADPALAPPLAAAVPWVMPPAIPAAHLGAGLEIKNDHGVRSFAAWHDVRFRSNYRRRELSVSAISEPPTAAPLKFACTL